MAKVLRMVECLRSHPSPPRRAEALDGDPVRDETAKDGAPVDLWRVEENKRHERQIRSARICFDGFSAFGDDDEGRGGVLGAEEGGAKVGGGEG
jgi:hypothetical protein